MGKHSPQRPTQPIQGCHRREDLLPFFALEQPLLTNNETNDNSNCTKQQISTVAISAVTQVCIFAGQLEKTQDTRFHSRSRRPSMSGQSGDQLVATGFSVCRPSLYLNCNVVSVLTFCLPSLALQIPSSTGPVPLYPLLI